MLFPRATERKAVRVVVTGVGIVTAYGAGWQANAQGFRAGTRAFRPVSLFDVSRQRVKVAAEVDSAILQEDPTSASSKKSRSARQGDRAAKLLLLAAREALGTRKQLDPSMPIVLGTTSGGMSMGEEFYRRALACASNTGQPTRVTHYLAQRQAINLCDTFGLRGQITIIANACAAGANAIGHASDLIRLGHAKRVIAGGYDALSHLVFAGFDSLQALSTTVCRPFDQGRDGLALGEGAAVLILESLESALERKAEIFAELSGYGAATDSHHLTQPHPEGQAALTTMSQACSIAGISPEQVGYINAHGTGTPLNDSSEAAAINRWGGESVSKVAVSSTKAGIGHLLGAAGAVEAVVSLMVLREGFLPPMPATQTPDPLCKFSLVRAPQNKITDYALTNSFGFGGANASLLFRRWT